MAVIFLHTYTNAPSYTIVSAIRVCRSVCHEIRVLHKLRSSNSRSSIAIQCVCVYVSLCAGTLLLCVARLWGTVSCLHNSCSGKHTCADVQRNTYWQNMHSVHLHVDSYVVLGEGRRGHHAWSCNWATESHCMHACLSLSLCLSLPLLLDKHTHTHIVNMCTASGGAAVHAMQWVHTQSTVCAA